MKKFSILLATLVVYILFGVGSTWGEDVKQGSWLQRLFGGSPERKTPAVIETQEGTKLDIDKGAIEADCLKCKQQCTSIDFDVEGPACPDCDCPDCICEVISADLEIIFRPTNCNVDGVEISITDGLLTEVIDLESSNGSFSHPMRVRMNEPHRVLIDLKLGSGQSLSDVQLQGGIFDRFSFNYHIRESTSDAPMGSALILSGTTFLKDFNLNSYKDAVLAVWALCDD